MELIFQKYRPNEQSENILVYDLSCNDVPFDDELMHSLNMRGFAQGISDILIGNFSKDLTKITKEYAQKKSRKAVLRPCGTVYFFH